MTGRLVVLEGLDGAGTTTQAALLAERLRLEGRRVHLTAEPSSGPVGALIRQVLKGRIGGGGNRSFDPWALALLFAADRRDHYAAEIAPKLAAGLDVVSDRFTTSSLAYQAADLGDMEWVASVNREAADAGLVVFLRVRPDVALRRRHAASVDREIFELSAFQRKVARRYEEAIVRQRADGQRVVEVDGERPVGEVAAEVWEAVRRLR
ncbi:MAG TPA: dTMP kinase [Anaeromyxobacter sp.]